MKQQNGFSMLGLMAVVAIIAVLAMVSMPIYNHYVEKSKVANAIPAIGNYKNAVANCFMEYDTLEVCNTGESGIPEGLDNEGRVLSLNVFEGNIIMEIDAQNHYTNTNPVKLAYVTSPDTHPTDASLNWSLLCNDYTGEGDRLLDTCVGSTDADSDGDGIEDGDENDSAWEPTSPSFTEWEITGSKNFGPWQPSVNNQTDDFEQTRSYEQIRTRERIIQERNRIDGTVREVTREQEMETDERMQNRMVSANEGETSIELENCSSWTPKASTILEGEIFDQTRTCDEVTEVKYNYFVDNNLITTNTITSVDDDKTFTQEETGTKNNPQEVCGYNLVTLWGSSGTLRTGIGVEPLLPGSFSKVISVKIDSERIHEELGNSNSLPTIFDPILTADKKIYAGDYMERYGENDDSRGYEVCYTPR